MKTTLQLLAFLTGLLISVFLVFYLKVNIYEFSEPKRFHGNEWYNPYESLSSIKVKANFHAHTKKWGGMTFGENSEEELKTAYQARNYDVIGISNYHSISDFMRESPLYIPLYEHGINIFKVHNLVVGAKAVGLPGFPLHFSLHQTQQMLQRTSRLGELNVLAHPTMSKLPVAALSKLSGYNLLEVGNTLGMSTAHWDAALSAGKPIWILSNDDTHDLLKEPTFIKWNIIFPEEKNAASVINALKRGQHYGVESYETDCEDYDLLECRIYDDTLIVAMSHSVNRIDLIGQNGVQQATFTGTDRIKYALKVEDTYIRVEVHMDHCVYYLNPILRVPYSDNTFDLSLYPHSNAYITWVLRFTVLICLILSVWMTFRLAIKITKRSDS